MNTPLNSKSNLEQRNLDLDVKSNKEYNKSIISKADASLDVSMGPRKKNTTNSHKMKEGSPSSRLSTLKTVAKAVRRDTGQIINESKLSPKEKEKLEKIDAKLSELKKLKENYENKSTVTTQGRISEKQYKKVLAERNDLIEERRSLINKLNIPKEMKEPVSQKSVSVPENPTHIPSKSPLSEEAVPKSENKLARIMPELTEIENSLKELNGKKETLSAELLRVNAREFPELKNYYDRRVIEITEDLKKIDISIKAKESRQSELIESLIIDDQEEVKEIGVKVKELVVDSLSSKDDVEINVHELIRNIDNHFEDFNKSIDVQNEIGWGDIEELLRETENIANKFIEENSSLTVPLNNLEAASEKEKQNLSASSRASESSSQPVSSSDKKTDFFSSAKLKISKGLSEIRSDIKAKLGIGRESKLLKMENRLNKLNHDIQNAEIKMDGKIIKLIDVGPFSLEKINIKKTPEGNAEFDIFDRNRKEYNELKSAIGVAKQELNRSKFFTGLDKTIKDLQAQKKQKGDPIQKQALETELAKAEALRSSNYVMLPLNEDLPTKPASIRQQGNPDPAFLSHLQSEKLKPLKEFIGTSDHPQIQNLGNCFVGLLQNLGAKKDDVEKFIVAGNASFKLPHIKDLNELKDDEHVVVATDGKTSVTYTGKEIKEMAESARAWTAGQRNGTFSDPGLSTGLTEKNKLAMAKVMTFSRCPRASFDVQGNIIPRIPGEAGHFVCNASAPDLQDAAILSAMSTNDQVDVNKIKTEFLEPILNDYIDECVKNGVEVINVGAIGLGVFSAQLKEPGMKEQYAQNIVDAVTARLLKHPDYKPTVVFAGQEFETVNLTHCKDAIQTNNELANCELAAGAAGKVSASLNAGDQNKLPGYHAWKNVNNMLGDKEQGHIAGVFAGNLKQDEMKLLRSPFFGIFQSPIFNPYLRDQLSQSTRS